jgi:hypothetical protein
MSLGFIARLVRIRTELGEDHIVLDEVDYLEGLRPPTGTKEEEQFRHAPLHPFFHKHFSAPRHILRNIGDRWGLGDGGNRDLLKMISRVAKKHGSDPDRWQRVLSYWLIVNGSRDRVGGRTGDWIIFAKHRGENYYLDLATHAEAETDPHALVQKLRDGSAPEFPFLFS